MSTPVNTSSTDSQMHNNIMAAGSKDRPPMLGPGRYSQWRSPVPEAEGRPAVQQHTAIETVLNMTPENKEHFQSEKEAIFLLLTGIGDEIYSTVDACNTANEMWIAIERLQQGESLNVQDVKTNLYTGYLECFLLQDWRIQRSRILNEWSRFVTIVKQAEKIDIVSYHRLFDILKQFQLEILTIKNQNLKDQMQHHLPKDQVHLPDTKAKRSPNQLHLHLSSSSEEDSVLNKLRGIKKCKKNLALLAKYFKKLYKPTNNNLRTSSNSKNKTEDTTPRYNNDNQSRQFGNQRTMTVAGARETVGSPVFHEPDTVL
ncbi:hypothetical protein Tco_1131680 [Tanacetum coccineum]|uniref:Gag protein n=1 Tax=Tanacetum coccineum TaxID=301880 RepID=A0ABQ5JDY6_9ASTR